MPLAVTQEDFFLYSKFYFRVLLVDLEQIRKRLKESLVDRCKNYMSTDWLPQDDAKTVTVQGYYTEPCWKRIVKKGVQDRRCYMKDGLYEIFKEETRKRKRILAEGMNFFFFFLNFWRT